MNTDKSVTLREITRDNIKAILALEVSQDQKKVYPRSNAYSIAEGHYPADDAPVWMRAIYTGETLGEEVLMMKFDFNNTN